MDVYVRRLWTSSFLFLFLVIGLESKVLAQDTANLNELINSHCVR